MSTEENKEIVRRALEILNTRSTTSPDELLSAATLDELFAPDYVHRLAAAGWRSSAHRGPQEARRFAMKLREAYPDLSITIEQLIAEGDKVVAVFTLSGTHRPTGRPINLPHILVLRICDGKIVEDWESINQGSLWQQLGYAQSPAS